MPFIMHTMRYGIKLMCVTEGGVQSRVVFLAHLRCCQNCNHVHYREQPFKLVPIMVGAISPERFILCVQSVLECLHMRRIA